MEQRISLITLGVTDLGRSIAFYEALGWRKADFPAEGVAFFQAGGIIFSLFPRHELASDSNIPESDLGKASSGFPGFTLSYNTRTRDEVPTILAEAERAGATILKPAQDAFWGGYYGHFADPDGFIWEVAWNPGFELADDGSISIPK